jgi:hypothetical protein
VISTAQSKIYAVWTEATVFGKTRSIAVYRNIEKATIDADARNEALKTITVELDRFAVDSSDLSEAKLHSKIRAVAGEWSGYIDIRVRRKGNRKSIEWSYTRHTLCAA